MFCIFEARWQTCFHNNVVASILPLHNQTIENLVPDIQKEQVSVISYMEWAVWDGFYRRRKIYTCTIHGIVHLLFTLLVMSRILQQYYVHHNIGHVTMHVKNPADTLLMSLCVSEQCSRHSARQESCRHIVHVTARVRTLFTSLYASGIL